MQLPGKQHRSGQLLQGGTHVPSSPNQAETRNRLSRSSKFHRLATTGEVTERQHHADARRAAKELHAESHGMSDIHADHPGFSMCTTLLGCIEIGSILPPLLDARPQLE